MVARTKHTATQSDCLFLALLIKSKQWPLKKIKKENTIKYFFFGVFSLLFFYSFSFVFLFCQNEPRKKNFLYSYLMRRQRRKTRIHRTTNKRRKKCKIIVCLSLEGTENGNMLGRGVVRRGSSGTVYLMVSVLHYTYN